MRSLRRLLGHHVPDVLLDLQQIRACHSHQRKQIAHARDLLDLFVEEPLQEAARSVIVFRFREPDKIVDLPSDPLFSAEGGFDDGLNGLESALRLGDRVELNRPTYPLHVVEDLHPVLTLLIRLGEEAFGENLECHLIERTGHGKIGVGGRKLQRNLLVELAVHRF